VKIFNGHDATAYIIPIGAIKSKGDLMQIDIYVKSEQLLHHLANSLYDRDPKNPIPICFTTADKQFVEKWIVELLAEAGNEN
jgi:hypothetical protein